jgi:hypothetical protein
MIHHVYDERQQDMITWLPDQNLVKSTNFLDHGHITNQAYEAATILHAIAGPGHHTGWSNLKGAAMWKGHDDGLALYLSLVIRQCRAQGIAVPQNPPYDFEKDYAPNLGNHWLAPRLCAVADIVWPEWLGEEKVHSSHRSNLLRKKPDFYRQFGWTDDPEAEIYWPVQ